jgi:hypothetical protein
MLQDILVWTIIAVAVVYAVYSLVRSLRSKAGSACCEGGCSCDAKREILKNLEKNKMRLVDKKTAGRETRQPFQHSIISKR